MSFTLAVLLLLSADLFTPTVGFGEDCVGYITSNNEYRSGFNCYEQHCCGNCDYRYCCSSEYSKLSDHDQSDCAIGNNSVAFEPIIVGVVFLLILLMSCCYIIYKRCKKPRPVVGAHVTTVMNAHCIQQQPVMQGGQYPQYRPVLTQPGYGGQQMQTGPYQGQPYAPGPPPSYQVATSPGYPTIQSAYDGGQAMYPMQPPAQTGVIYMPSETSTQPVYNPAYIQPPNTGY